MPILDDPSESLSPNSGSSKVFVAEPDSVSPALQATSVAEKEPSRASNDPKQFRASIARRPSGRRTPTASTSSLNSVGSVSSLAGEDIPEASDESASRRHLRHHHSNHVFSQVAAWLQQEKAKKIARKSKTHVGHSRIGSAVDTNESPAGGGHIGGSSHDIGRTRTSSDASDGGLALENLEQILAKGLDLDGDGLLTPTEEKKGSYFPRRGSTRRPKLRKSSTVASSDTDFQDGDALVPAAEVILDNTKTLSYGGGAADSQLDLPDLSKRGLKEKQAWLQFKKEIVRLTHTLRLKGWRQVQLDQGGDIDVERLSGALTNAVYVVSPPTALMQTPTGQQDGLAPRISSKPPAKLLLRIYGPQVEHLIDRENELQILRRLARKKIGPRLLGTFINGRFEQFFHARTLTAADLRIPGTSKQIAKRMRELHDGIELLEEERDNGPFLWQNWDKWVERCEEVTTWLDKRILSGAFGQARTQSDEWSARGLICGVEWSVFRRTVERYRTWLDAQYGGRAGIRQQLVFAHNDTQYGNLLRLQPTGESPLLIPANEHKQLIVIDFEYASANVPGLEFANHFTEWCYNYHDSNRSYALTQTNYPTKEEQHRFLKAYVQHQPWQHPSRTPAMGPSPSPGPSSSISSFVLDSRAPPAQIADEEARRDEATETEVKRLMLEARIWRAANSAQWVAWGIVQAKVPGMDEALKAQNKASSTIIPTSTMPPPLAPQVCSQEPHHQSLASDPLSPEAARVAQDAHDKRREEAEADNDEEEEFDYLGYAQERAMLFWGDVLQLGLVKMEELPDNLKGKVKVVEH